MSNRARKQFPSLPGNAKHSEEEEEDDSEDSNGSNDSDSEDDSKKSKKQPSKKSNNNKKRAAPQSKGKPKPAKRPKRRSLAFRSPQNGEELNIAGPPGRRRLGASSNSSSSLSKSIADKQRRDEEYLAVYRTKLNSNQIKALNSDCTLQRLVLSSAVYDSLAKKKGKTGSQKRPPKEGVLDKVSLKFTLSQEVYLALFQARGSSRRIQNNAREGNASPAARAFAIFKKEKLSQAKQNTKKTNTKKKKKGNSGGGGGGKDGSIKLTTSAITDAWKALTNALRKPYLDAAAAENKSKHANVPPSSTTTTATTNEESSLTTSSSSSSSSTSSTSSTSSSSSKKKSKGGYSRNTNVAPVLFEVRRFNNVRELASIFGPASMVRIVSSMLTPSGRVKVKHVVRQPVLLKYDGKINELSVGFSVAAEFVRNKK